MFGQTCNFHIGLSAKQAFYGLICLLTAQCSLGQTVKDMQIPLWASTGAGYSSNRNRLYLHPLYWMQDASSDSVFNNFWMGLILRHRRERWERKIENIITVCTCSKISLLLHLCPNFYSILPFLCQEWTKTIFGSCWCAGMQKSRRRIKRDVSSAIKSLKRLNLCMWDSQLCVGCQYRWIWEMNKSW